MPVDMDRSSGSVCSGKSIGIAADNSMGIGLKGDPEDGLDWPRGISATAASEEISCSSDMMEL